MNFPMSRFSKVIVRQTDRQTDGQTQPKLYTTLLLGWSTTKLFTLNNSALYTDRGHFGFIIFIFFSVLLF